MMEKKGKFRVLCYSVSLFFSRGFKLVVGGRCGRCGRCVWIGGGAEAGGGKEGMGGWMGKEWVGAGDAGGAGGSGS